MPDLVLPALRLPGTHKGRKAELNRIEKARMEMQSQPATRGASKGRQSQSRPQEWPIQILRVANVLRCYQPPAPPLPARVSSVSPSTAFVEELILKSRYLMTEFKRSLP